jgi:UDP-glucose 4-epimerase
MNIIITGGGGFIGLNLLTNMLKANSLKKIYIIDDFSNSSKKNIFDVLRDSNLEFVNKKKFILSNKKKLIIKKKKIKNLRSTDIIFKSKIDAIIHLAAQTGVPNSVKNPIDDANRNIIDTLNILEICREKKIKKVIFSSSIGVIGNSLNHKITSPKPISPYACSKFSAENYMRIYWELYRIKTICLRFSNVYGKYSMNKGSVVAKFIKDIIKNKNIKIIGDGKQTRDFIYADDLAKLILKIIYTKNTNLKEINYLNIASGKSTSINYLVSLLLRIAKRKMKKSIKIKYKKEILGEIKQSRPSIDTLLNIFPKTNFINLEKGLEKTFDWLDKI